MGKKVKGLCRWFLICIYCKCKETSQDPIPLQIPASQCPQNQSTLSHIDNSLQHPEKGSFDIGYPRCNSKPDGRSASVSPAPMGNARFPKTTIITGSASVNRYNPPAIPTLAPRVLHEDDHLIVEASGSQEDSAGRYIPVSFSESSVHSYPCIPSSPSDEKVLFYDKNSELSSPQEASMSAAEQNLREAGQELEANDQFQYDLKRQPETEKKGTLDTDDREQFSRVMRGINFKELMHGFVSEDSEMPNTVLERERCGEEVRE